VRELTAGAAAVSYVVVGGLGLLPAAARSQYTTRHRACSFASLLSSTVARLWRHTILQEEGHREVAPQRIGEERECILSSVTWLTGRGSGRHTTPWREIETEKEQTGESEGGGYKKKQKR
jgi:hypothetical protein